MSEEGAERKGAPRLHLEGVYKWLGDHPVLQGVDLEIRPREILVVIGRSGCGKSVLLKHIIGLIRPDEGHVWVDGQDISQLDEAELLPIRRRFGMVFQGGALLDSLTVAENVGLGLVENFDLPPSEVARRVSGKLELVGLAGIEPMMPAALSGGMRKRVAIARALAMDPDIILYDEPTTGLDPIMSAIICGLIMDLRSTLGVTSVVVTHDMESAVQIGDCVAMLHRGNIRFEGAPQELREASDPAVRQFVEGRAEGPIQPGVADHWEAGRRQHRMSVRRQYS